VHTDRLDGKRDADFGNLVVGRDLVREKESVGIEDVQRPSKWSLSRTKCWVK
jgi:hypothetical protein